MLADITKTEEGCIARYERHFNHPVERVWARLTDNEQLNEWFAELSIDDLRVGGLVKFDMRDGTFEEMRILDLETNAVLEYEWGADRVRFELYPEGEGCRLLMMETITSINDHTHKDLAGWHVCLDVIGALLDGRVVEKRDEQWAEWRGRYEQAVNEIRHGNA